MAGLELYTSNRLENLAEELAKVLARPLPSPFEREVIVVQSQGMARWLKLELAARLGVCANCDFPFPNEFARRMFAAALPGLPEDDAFVREVMVWRILDLLPRLAGQPGFEPVEHYLRTASPAAGEDAGAPLTTFDARKRWQLAARLAHLFDQYLLYRPELVTEWDEGRGQEWQAVLWREMNAGLGQRHTPALFPDFVKAMKRLAQSPGRAAGSADPLPARVCVFGISALPEFHLAVFGTLAQRTEVNFFLLQPSREYWGLITSPREKERLLKRAGRDPAAAGEFHFETGNRLLASLGRLGRDFLNLILGAGDWEEHDCFAEPKEDTLLHAIQSDIFHLHDRGRTNSDFALSAPSPRRSEGESDRLLPPHPGPLPEGEGETTPALGEARRSTATIATEPDVPLSLWERAGLRGNETDAPNSAPAPKLAIHAADDSLRLHSCHSPLREVEVLHDHLLAWFQADPTLKPRDVLVMTPDIETYAPFIQAVFESPENDAQRIPFSLADRASRREHRVVDTFLRLLRLPDSRLTAPEVLTLLETPAVRDRFQLTEPDLDRLRHWVRETNIRWGIDAGHRAALGLPEYPENTWRHGLDRLLLGYAMAGRGEHVVEGVLPFDDLEGASAETLGRFCEFAERLFATAARLKEPRPVPGWEDTLRRLLDDFVGDADAWQEEAGVVRAALSELRLRATRAGFADPVPLVVMQEALDRELEDERYSSGFLTGGVTFCALKPMRSIPFRVIGVLGLNDGAFPRTDAKLAFDLMAKNPRPGDRSVREDDRYLSLETLLSARDRLHLSYVGQSQRDNSPLPPSVVVSELLDYVKQGFALAAESSSSSSSSSCSDASVRSPAALDWESACVPPHPGPLPPGEGESAPARGEGRSDGNAEYAAQCSPSPRGEGWGEGDSDVALRRDQTAWKSPAEHRTEARGIRHPVSAIEHEDDGRGRARARARGGSAGVLLNQIVVHHRLQAFSAAYFDGSDARLFSFSGENCDASRTAGADRTAACGFIAKPLAEPEREFLRLDLAALADFLVNPARFLVTRRLGLRLPSEDAPIEDREPFALEGLDTYTIKQELVEAHLARAEFPARLAAIQAAGRLPAGESGRIPLAGMRRETEEFVRRLQPELGGPLLESLAVALEIDGFQLTGQLRPRTARGLVSFRCASVKAMDLLRHWVQHLALCAAVPSAGARSVLVSEDGVRSFRPVANAREELEKLLALYWRGLTEPLRFFPESAMAFVKTERAKVDAKKSKDPLQEARKQWAPDDFGRRRPESEDVWFDLCFRHCDPDPLDDEFQTLARCVFEPLLDCAQEVEE